MKVSFDFDGTLSTPRAQEYAKELIDRGVEVWVVTSRYEDFSRYLNGDFEVGEDDPVWNHKDLFEVMDNLGIPKEHLVFTNFEFKINYFYDNTDFAWHLDDNFKEVNKLNGAGVVGLIFGGNWENKCEKFLKKVK